MHIVDGVLPGEILVMGAALSAGAIAYALKHLEEESLPRVGVLSAVLFIASYIHLPIGFSSIHLLLNGLIGLALGWVAFPALFIALLLQAVFFGFGGFLVLGVNAFNIAFPAVLMYYLCRPGISSCSPKLAAFWGGVAGAGAVLLTSLLVSASLVSIGDSFWLVAKISLLTHIPLMLVEGFVTGAAVLLLRQIKPEFLNIKKGFSRV